MYSVTFFYPPPSGEAPILLAITTPNVLAARSVYITLKLGGAKVRMWTPKGQRYSEWCAKCTGDKVKWSSK